jgi:hypothetical protein
MRFLLEPEDVATLDAAVAAGRAARDAGLDGVLLRPSPALPAPLVVAAALAPAVDGILIAAEVPLGDRHPIEVAEEAAVTDLAAAGRLVLVATPAPGCEAVFGEALDLLRTAATARPFRFEGERWTVPARLPQNEHNLEDRTRVTPAPLQPRLEVWTSGAAGPDPRRALGHLAPAAADPSELCAAWARAEAALGPALIGAPRARRHDVADPAALIAALRAGRLAFGQDWAVVRAPSARAARIGREVRPHVQLDRLPPGLEDHWASAPV